MGVDGQLTIFNDFQTSESATTEQSPQHRSNLLPAIEKHPSFAN
jgi:hypothetical protein